MQSNDSLVTDNLLAIQFARYVLDTLPTHDTTDDLATVTIDHQAIQTIVIRLIDALSHGHSCLLLTPSEHQTMLAVHHPALVLNGQWLYLSRYASYEDQLATELVALSQQSLPHTLSLDQYFSDEYQKQSADLALTKQLAIITGGPGTGKTTTVVKILALLLQQNPKLRIALSAPTGKAAMRLSESIENSLQNSDIMRGFETVLTHIPRQAQTLHRLLGARPFSVEFRHDRDNPLLEDVVVVDEASMIDLALMVKLVQSLKPKAKLILLGDKDQLASVESGAVLADCYQALQKNRVELQNTYRFSGKIKELALAVNQQKADEVMTLLSSAQASDPIAWHQTNHSLHNIIRQHYQAYFDRIQSVRTEEDVHACFELFNQFKLLSPLRQGQMGVTRLNQLAEQALSVNETWYCGRPIMITQNDANTKRYNGDIGLCLTLNNSEEKRIFFKNGNQLEQFIPSRLPAHETAFAMTIHKSQGSEFGHVMILLPNLTTTTQANDADQSLEDASGLLTKELLYTAITRGKQKVTLVAEESVIRTVVSEKVRRNSGLSEKLTYLR